LGTFVVLIVGNGYIGKRVQERLRSQNRSVQTLGRSDANVIVDLDQFDMSKNIEADEVLYLVPPPSEGDKDLRLKRFLSLLNQASLPSKIVLISTSGVYGDCAGSLVDESAPVAPKADRALRRLDAEQQLLAYAKGFSVEVVILRVTGIYGKNRLPIKRLETKTPMIEESAAPWTNRVHAEDLVTVCLAAMEKGVDGEVYNVSDGHPGNMTDYFNQVADAVGLDRPVQISQEEAEETLSVGMLSYLKESRRISNKKMLNELGVELQYPTLALGLKASV